MTPVMDQVRFRRAFLLLLVLAISSVFVAMIHRFVVALFLGAIFSGLFYPLYKRVLSGFKNRRALAAGTTLVICLLVIVIPLSGLLGLVAAEAIRVSEVVGPWIQEQVQKPSPFEEHLPDWLPFFEQLEPYRSQIIAKAGELAGRLGSFFFNSVSAMTKGTVSFFLSFFIFLYAMFYFLIDGRAILDRILYYTPLSYDDKCRMLEKFESVARATLKGTLVIGIIQGALGGIAFWVVGIEGSAFWGTVMAVLSIIPGVGTAIVWVPAVIYLFATAQMAKAIGLLIWCAAVVGTADNFLRPRLVGQDTKMPDLLILLGTLGGIFFFGAVGLILGPIIAALFVTIWDIYGNAFSDLLPEPAPQEGEDQAQ